MPYWIIFFCALIVVCAQPSDNNDRCAAIHCVGEEYECINGRCHCAEGYIPDQFQIKCIPCPGLGEKCSGRCCNRYGNGSLQCWQNICQSCYDTYGNLVCRDSLDQILLISTTQIIMGATLVLGIIVTFILLYKLCTVKSLRPLGNGPSAYNTDGRLSIGSLQLYVEERLRDAPPRYSRAPASGSAIYPAVAYLNSGFIHDSSIPPPPYTERKNDNVSQTQSTIHI
ncbi:uncharacterized protein LOC115456420 [Manduca sexta]|uniref:Uncharacterized protein n=1 Tax=Manduca sexta TaxID=7130 RepID=A0A922CEQ0_MANSE|nr:uncharacterized protein LOC115456420 [Manduca sexta]KAG6444215.1 hypothetical protein O3G_MSEX003271 [Manduca sexta]